MYLTGSTRSGLLQAVGAGALIAGMFGIAPAAFAQAVGTNVPDPAASSSSDANPNEGASADRKKKANAAVTDDAQPEAATADPQTDPAGQDIVVTGFRRSLQTAVTEKKTQDQIVESVSAEDIGKLPDNSIGESIARLPGVTSQRTGGRANVISIRGFGPDFSSTLLNGREQTSTNDNRSVEFDQFPSEVVNQVVIYKSPSASLIGQGLVGTIDVRTVRPLEYNDRVIAIGGRGSYTDRGKLNSGSQDLGYRVNAAYIDKFADDHIGLSLAASYVDEPYQQEEFNAWGFFNPNGNAAGNVAPSGSKSYVTSSQLKRLGLNGTVQVRPVPEFTATFDGFYSHFNDTQIKRGIELPFSFFGSTFDGTGATTQDGVFTSGAFNNVQGVVRNDIQSKIADLYSAGVNLKWEGDDGWNAFFDFGYSRTNRTELSFQSYAGTGYDWDDPSDPSDNFAAGDRTDRVGFVSNTKGTTFTHQLNYSDPNLILLTDPLGWGGSTVQAGYYNNRIVVDQLKQYRAEVEKELEGSFLSGVRLGLAYTDRDKSLTPDESFVVLSSGARQQVIPNEYILKPTNLEYLGLGPVLSYDPRQLLAGGVFTLVPNQVRDVLNKFYSIREDLMAGYVQGDIKQDIGSAQLTGNAGVQAVWTAQKSTGFIYPPAGPQRATLSSDYWDILPSGNLSLRLASDWVFRLAAAREIMRPRLNDMRVSIDYGVDTSVPGQPIIRGGGGNPYLKPYRANAVDFNIEKYFNRSGYIAVQVYYKDIKSFIYNGRIPFNYSAFPVPNNAAGFPNLSPIGTLDAPVNTGGGKLYGAEAAATLPFGIIASFLDGFGATGGVAYAQSKVKDPDGNVTRIPGYSKWTANGTLFYEKSGFNVRGSARYRTGFLGDFGNFDGNTIRKEALDELIIDAQIGYDFGKGSYHGLSIYIQGQNLTNEPFTSIAAAGQNLQVTDNFNYGRRFLAGFTYRF